MATTTGHERSKGLYNFSLPNLWGTRRQLRCMKAADDSDGGGSSGGDQRLRRRSSNSELDNRNRRSLVEESSEKEGIEEFREKIMLDLRNVADKMTESIFREQVLVGDDEEDKEPEAEMEMEMEMEDCPPPPPEAPGATVEVRPWNLRKRRAACKAPIPRIDSNQFKGLGIEENKRVLKMRLEYTLSKKEIEDDYMKIFGQRPPRRPMKRSRTVQRQIDLLNPASYITEITEELYNVRDQAERGKR
ncbi:PREDICTED: uncharacterized protein LOC104787872 [Camelina sativa]|uniref:Uncharacterized protein LOC104787872 n=1 Tax=Camelina sativa TaxID=90675 RepID=A0ABM0Z896_CAMSA|nr:PREDICTED: uncharacterized protein LOC104787872 [Camelina sativa]